MITKYDNNTTSGFAACKQCHKVLAFDSRKIDTLSLRKYIGNWRGKAVAARAQEHNPLC